MRAAGVQVGGKAGIAARARLDRSRRRTAVERGRYDGRRRGGDQRDRRPIDVGVSDGREDDERGRRTAGTGHNEKSAGQVSVFADDNPVNLARPNSHIRRCGDLTRLW